MFTALKAFTDKVGPLYGTEDKGIFLYSLIKMQQATTVLELGTGLGVSALWMATAATEVQGCKFYTIDSGEQWSAWSAEAVSSLGVGVFANYAEYIDHIFSTYGVQQSSTFICEDIIMEEAYILSKTNGTPPDFIFADFNHSIDSVAKMLTDLVPMVGAGGTIIIDSLPTYVPAYLFFTACIEALNKGYVPHRLLNLAKDMQRTSTFYEKNTLHAFHFVENKYRDQNSCTVIKVLSKDILPYGEHTYIRG